MNSPFIRLIQNPVRFYHQSLVPKIRRQFPALSYYKGLSALEKEFVKKLSRYKVTPQAGNSKVVLMQMVEDHTFCIKLTATAHHLAKKLNANIGLYNVESRIERPHYPTNNFLNNLLSEKQDKIYTALGGVVLHRNTDVFPDNAIIITEFARIKKEITSKHDVLNIHIEDIKIGDLVYDTYLRFADKSTVDIKDPFLDNILLQSLHIYFNCKQLLQKQNIVALVNSYTTYTKHGIMARLCLKKDIPVYTPLCGFISIVHKVIKSFPTHRNNHFTYKKMFNALGNKEEIAEKYKELFEKRFEGVIDGATSYMKQSAFSGETNPELNNVDWKNTVMVLAHCFFDSPHIYRDLLFPDFYEWMTFTLDELRKQKGLTILVKQHPNGMPQNDGIFAGLKEKYKNDNIVFINKKTSQLQIINSRPKAIITAYGTAAAEFSYQDFPVLTIYDNPFTAFDFTHLAKSIEEYRTMLGNIMHLPSKCDKKAIIEYYYMHNYFFLNGRDADYLSFLKFRDDSYSDNFLNAYLPLMNSAYFEMLDASISEGMALIDWEFKICEQDYK